jgi:hypothetical protein
MFGQHLIVSGRDGCCIRAVIHNMLSRFICPRWQTISGLNEQLDVLVANIVRLLSPRLIKAGG